jgi:anaerobic magnesium-protoporphyrin IX monomethyl ester cyclase
MASARYPVLFVMAPGGFTHHFPEHLGTAFLRTILRRAGIESRQYLPKGNPSLSGFAAFLRRSRPRVLGFTVYEANLRASRALIRTARETLPNSITVVGGPNATFTPHDTLDLLRPHLCFRGAGEGIIVPLVSKFLGSDSANKTLPDLIQNIPNLVFSTGDSHHHTRCGNLSSFPAAFFATLDDIPSPFQDNVVSRPDIGYLTSRGCNQHCTFCSFAALSARRVAYHSIGRVLDDLSAIQTLRLSTQLPIPSIQVFDDTFTLVPERARLI